MKPEQNFDIKTASSEQLGLMLGDTAMQMNQLYQNYQALANELRSRIPQTALTQTAQENQDGRQ